MKTRFILLFSLFLSCSCYLSAQNHFHNVKRFNPYDRYWLMDFTGGANFDLSSSRSNPNASIIATRPDVAPVFGVRVNHLFAKKFGWYGNFQISFYKEKDGFDRGTVGKFMEALFDELFMGMSRWHPSIDVGLLYRFEKNRFRLYPSVGVGFNGHMSEQSTTKTIKNNDGVKQDAYYKQRPCYFSANFGVTANYYLTKRSFLILRATLQQPLKRTSAEIIYKEGSAEKDRISYNDWTKGRNLNVSLGYGFAFGKRMRR